MREHAAQQVRQRAALATGAIGAISYNWWIAAAAIPGLMHSPNGFFSDLEAQGLRDSSNFQHADVIAGLCWVIALFLRGRTGSNGRRRSEWPWLVAFAAFGVIGGIFIYACPEGTSSVCRNLEWHLHLPLHHYIHALAGIAEFATLTIGVGLAARQRRSEHGFGKRSHQALFIALLALYPLFGVAYLADGIGEIVEPLFFVIFTVVIALELIEPTRRANSVGID